MIVVDPRRGSGELVPILRNRFRLPAEEQHLDFGDIAFAGHGPKGWQDVGIEVKKLPDLLGSLDDHRLIGHQLRGMHLTYEEVWLAVIGEWAADKEGYLTVPRTSRSGKRQWVRPANQVLLHALEGRLLTLQIKGGVRFVRHNTPYQLCRWVGVMYHWWQKRWQDHHSLDVFYAPPPDDRRILRRPLTQVRLWAKELPGIEWTLSERVEGRFRSALAMANATPAEWAGIPGIGKAKAKAAWAAIREENSNVERQAHPRDAVRGRVRVAGKRGRHAAGRVRHRVQPRAK